MIRKSAEQSAAAQQMAVAAHRQNTLAALFLPIATLETILGTTLTDNWSWSQSHVHFVMLIVVGILLGFVVNKLINRPYHADGSSR